jgi:hypothetical protein
MSDEYQSPAERRWQVLVYYSCALCWLLTFALVSTHVISKRVEETVTLDPGQPVHTSSFAPLITRQELAPSDADVETAGDRVAEAMIHLKRQQNELALNALVQAQAATERAMKSKPRVVAVRDELEQTNEQIERVKQVIRRGKVEKATLELQDVNQKLESVSY